MSRYDDGMDTRRLLDLAAEYVALTRADEAAESYFPGVERRPGTRTPDDVAADFDAEFRALTS